MKSFPAFATLTAFAAVKSAVVPRTCPVRLICPCSVSTASAEPALPTEPAPVTPVLPDRIVFASPATDPVLATSTAPAVAATFASVVAVTAPLSVALPVMASISTAPSVADTLPSTSVSASFIVTLAPLALTAPVKSFPAFASVMSSCASKDAPVPDERTAPLSTCMRFPPFAFSVSTSPAETFPRTRSPLPDSIVMSFPADRSFADVNVPPVDTAVRLPWSTDTVPFRKRFPLAVAETSPSSAVTFPSSRLPLPDSTVTLFPASRSCAVVNFPPVAVAVRLPLPTDTRPFKVRFVAAVRTTSPPAAVMFVAVRCPPAVALMPFPASTTRSLRSFASCKVTLPPVAVAVTNPVKSFPPFCSTMSPPPAVSVLVPPTSIAPAPVIDPVVDSNVNPLLPAVILFTAKLPWDSTVTPPLSARMMSSSPPAVPKTPPAVNTTSPVSDITTPAVRFVPALAVTFPSAVTSASVRSPALWSLISPPDPTAVHAVTAPPKSLASLYSTMSPAFSASSVLAPPTVTNPPLCCVMLPPCAVTVRPSAPAITVCNEMASLFEEMSTPSLPLTMLPAPKVSAPFVAAIVTILPSITPSRPIPPPFFITMFPSPARTALSPAKVKSPATAVNSMFPDVAVRVSARVRFVAARAVRPFAALTSANAMSPPAVMATCAPACHMPSACWMSLAAYNVMAVGSTVIVSGSSPPVVTTEVPFVNPSVAMVMSPPSV